MGGKAPAADNDTKESPEDAAKKTDEEKEEVEEKEESA